MAQNCAVPSELFVIQLALSLSTDEAQFPIKHEAMLSSSMDFEDHLLPRIVKRSSKSWLLSSFKSMECHVSLCTAKLAKQFHAACFKSSLGLRAAKISSVGSSGMLAEYSWN